MMSGASTARPSGVGRKCTRSGCSEVAVCTLIYIYADSTAVLGPLATFAEPHAFDLCEVHRGRLSVPKGWRFIEHSNATEVAEPSQDDLMAIADAVREVAKLEVPTRTSSPEIGRRGHLRAIPNND